jgi:hypothetical protein
LKIDNHFAGHTPARSVIRRDDSILIPTDYLVVRDVNVWLLANHPRISLLAGIAFGAANINTIVSN